MALGTGLPEHELIALWVGDVFRAGRPRPRLLLSVFKGSGKASGTQEVLLSESLRGKLRRFWAWKVPPSAISAGWSASSSVRTLRQTEEGEVERQEGRRTRSTAPSGGPASAV